MGPLAGQSWPDRQVLITRRLRQRRAELGLTQKQVVTRLGRCGLETTNRALSSLEHGAGVDVAKLPELAAALDCTITYLLGLTDEPHHWEPDVPHVPHMADAGHSADPGHSAHPSLPAHSWILGLEIPEPAGRFGSDGAPSGR